MSAFDNTRMHYQKLALAILFSLLSCYVAGNDNAACNNASSCNDCLQEGCSWYGTTDCLSDCNQIADVFCYSENEERFQNMPISEVCAEYEKDEADFDICGDRSLSCSDCVETVKSDGISTCEWYEEAGFCGIGGCQLQGCGSDTCPDDGCSGDGGDGGDGGRSLRGGVFDGGDGDGGAEGDGDGGDGGGGGDDAGDGGDSAFSGDREGGDEGDGDGGDFNGGDDCDDGTPGLDLCFSGQNTVEVMDQGLVTMDSLKIGDFVRVGGGTFAKVYSFGHYNTNQKSEYLQIKTENNNSLEITKNHMVFTNKNDIIKAVPASSINVGDLLLTNENKSTSKVSNIRTVLRNGSYAPFTTSGDIIVSGIVASNYISMIENTGLPVSMQWIAHTFNAPHRMVCAMNFNICKNEKYTKEGLSFWIYLPYHIALWLANQNIILKFIGTTIFITTSFLVPIATIVTIIKFLIHGENKKC